MLKKLKESDKKTKIVILLIAVFTIAVLGTFTYAYFSAGSVSGNSGANNIVLETASKGRIIVTYDNNKNNINMDQVALRENEKNTSYYDYLKFDVEYIGNLNQNIIIYWQDVTNTFCQYASGQTCTDLDTDTYVGDELNYTLYECNETIYNSVTSGDDTDLDTCTIVGTEHKEAPVTGSDDNLNTSTITMNNNTKYYVLSMRIDNKDAIQNYNQAKSFSGRPYVDLEGATIRGVAYQSNGEVLANGSITIQSDPKGATTDANGNYYFKNIPYGNHTITIKDNSNNTIGTNEIKIEKGNETKTANTLTVANNLIETDVQTTSATQTTFLPTYYASFGVNTISFNNKNYLKYKILTDPNVTKSTATPTLTKAAVTQDYITVNSFSTDNYVVENGIYQTTDDDGITYFYRGHVENNYVKFAGFIWRIVRINGDGSIRIVLDGLTSTVKKEGSESFAGSNVQYNNYNYDTGTGPSNAANEEATAIEYASYDGGNLEGAMKTFYETYIYNTGSSIDYSGFLADSTFCSDTSWGTKSSNWEFAPYTRLTSGTSTLTCVSDYRYKVANNKLDYPIATLTSDEINYAGASGGASFFNIYNQNYYLYNATTTSPSWWTMSPFYWGSFGSVDAFYVISAGYLNGSYVNYGIGVRPVVNLKAETLTTTGYGTSDHPYEVG